MKRKILMLSHQMSRTGAVVALFKMAKILKKVGNEVMVLSVEEGPMQKDFQENNIEVVVCGKYFLYPEGLKKIAMKYDVVVANTILNFPATIILNGTRVKVIWWIHEHQAYFDYGKGEIPNPYTFASNIIVCAAGKYVQKIIANNFSYTSKCLDVGIEDVGQCERLEKEDISNRAKFLVVGTFGLEKGQDIVLEALQKMPTHVHQQVQVVMVGDFNGKDEKLFQKLDMFSKKKDSLVLHDIMEQEELHKLYKKVDCVIVPSRNETLSMVGVEAMMHKIPIIVSSGAGLSLYIDEGKNGYVFQKENSSILLRKMEQIVEQKEKAKEIGENGYQVFKKYFSEEVFEKNVKEMF